MSQEIYNTQTDNLARDAKAIAVQVGSALIRAEKLCNSGADWTGSELVGLAAEINMLLGMVNGLYYSARQLLSDDDFSQFVYRSGVKEQLIHEGIECVKAKLNSNQHEE